MKKLKLVILILIISITALICNGCNKGKDTVDFSYYLDSSDRRIVHFNAKGKSDYGTFEYSWNFGDGYVGTGKEITHEYSDFGTFTITLFATIEDSKIETQVVKEIEVKIPEITNLDFEVIQDKQNPRLYNFKAASNSDYGNVEYEWDFGDGTTSSGNNVQYGFSYFGVYEIELKAKLAEYDKVSSITKKDVSIPAPAITKLEIYAEQDDSNPFMYHFRPIAEASWGTLEYEWSFGDGKISINEETTNTYSSYSSYTVKVTARIKETGTEKTESREITVQTPVFKNYEITHQVDTNDPLLVYFTIENKDENDSEDMSQQDSFYWEFGDGETASGLRVQHRYESYGNKYLFVTLRTANQTQKTLTKTINLETPLINNVKINGHPSLKAGNIIEYNVSVDSQFSDEIEYEWEFSDGTIKYGRIIQREMSYWEQGENGYITEKIYLRTSIPRLNISVRNTEPYEIQILKPTILNFDISCSPSINNPKLFTCDTRDENGKKPISSAGGEIEYEWIFNGQTYTGANQRFELPELDTNYQVYVTATISNTNISISIPKILSASDDQLGMDCSAKIVDENHSDALKVKCQPLYNTNIHTAVNVKWDYGDGSQVTEDEEHTYEKAGIYNIKMYFNSTQITNVVKEKQIPVLIKVRSYFDRGSKEGTADCGGWQTKGIFTSFNNNFSKFNQDDFTITNVFSTANESCKCKGAGWKHSDNTWHALGSRSADCWGNIDQYVITKICPKGYNDNYCISN